MISHPRETMPTIEYVDYILVRMLFTGTLDFYAGHEKRRTPVRADKFINASVLAAYAVVSGKADVVHI